MQLSYEDFVLYQLIINVKNYSQLIPKPQKKPWHNIIVNLDSLNYHKK